METEILKARISDTASICEKTQKMKFLGFLSREEAVLAQRILKNNNSNFSLFGGYENAERVMLGCFPDWVDEFDFPITAVTFTYRKTDALRHRDFLGSLMAIGLKRESIGDILIEEGRAVTFVCEEIAEYIVSQMEKIGRTGVTVTNGFSLPLPEADELQEFSATVASVRLDCVVSAITNTSRTSALQMINEGRVSVNSVLTEKPTKSLADGDVVTVRGKGKFIIESLTDKTRKERFIVKYKKYV